MSLGIRLRPRSAAIAVAATLLLFQLACRSEEDGAPSASRSRGPAAAGEVGDRSAGSRGGSTKAPPAPEQQGAQSGDDDIKEVRLARGTLAASGIPLYPGAQGLDALEFDKNGMPFILVDFFTHDPPENVVAFYDRELRHLTRRRDTVIEPGAVRYEFEERFSGLVVRPWDGKGADSTAMLARFDRRDAQGVTSEELDAYGNYLAGARSHVVVNVRRPQPGPARS
jgi:hypothetical protein